MAVKIVSPGVVTRENDQSQITEGPIVAGAALIGPTAKGPAMVPTQVSNYTEFVSIFGDYVTSGSTDADMRNYSFLTNSNATELMQNLF